MSIKMFKGFDKDLKCRGFQYEIGKEYKEEKADLCHKGFHACENPLDTFGYYEPGKGSRYCVVELDDVSDQKDGSDTKRCGKVIKIGAELDVAGICKAHFDYVTARCNPAKSNVAGDKEAASAGESGSASAGSWGSASAGESGSASAGSWGSASAGSWGSASAGESGSASAGSWGSASAGSWGSASAGESGSASAGESGSASAGYRGSASAGSWGSASAGYRGSASAGYRGSASAGESGIACCRGGKVKGDKGCAICCAELDDYGNNIGIVAAIVDGKKIKADTWYTAKNGKFVEVK
jgi:hypothetical protein